jgi:hypothetical protein
MSRKFQAAPPNFWRALYSLPRLATPRNPPSTGHFTLTLRVFSDFNFYSFHRIHLPTSSFSLLPSTPLRADEKKAGAGKGGKAAEKLFNTGAVFGTGAARKVNIATKESLINARRVPLKGGRGRKPLKVMKKHIDIAKRKKLFNKLKGIQTGLSRASLTLLYYIFSY